MRWTDETVDRMLGELLRAGVLLSMSLVMTGGVWYLATHNELKVDYQVFQGEQGGLREIPAIVRGAAAGQPLMWIKVGLLVLIATPVARVVFSAFAFWIQGDRKFVIITLIVLAVLLYSLFAAGW